MRAAGHRLCAVLSGDVNVFVERIIGNVCDDAMTCGLPFGRPFSGFLFDRIS